MSSNQQKQAGSSKTGDIRLIISDLDGTLLNPEQKITERARAAVLALKAKNILFTAGTSRPRPGVLAFARELEIELPMFTFNGGAFLDGQQEIISEMVFPKSVAQRTFELLQANGVPCWALTDDTWYVQDLEGSHISRGGRVFSKPPRPWSELDLSKTTINKIVGVSDDETKMAAAETATRERLGQTLSYSRSQSYYLDITPAGADKGNGVLTLSSLLGIPLKNICTLGDMPVDVPMFKLSGFSIAMANGPKLVQDQAKYVAGSNRDDGFAKAIEELFL